MILMGNTTQCLQPGRGALRRITFLLLIVGISGWNVPAAAASGPANIVVFTTDFGLADDSVPICKGVMYSIAPELRIVDLTHQVTPYSILDRARFLYGASPYYPPGTVFVAVVDPGVGGARESVVVKSARGQYFGLPDSGLSTLVA